MKTTLSNRTQHTRVLLQVLGGMVIVLLVVGGILLWRNQLTGLLWRITSSVSPTRSVDTALSALRAQFASKASLEEQNTGLEAQLASTTAALADRNVLYQENLDLKNRLGRDANIQSILASVLMRPPAIPYDVLLIDVGERDGVAPGQFVSAGGTTVIGVISEVYTSTSRVTLFSTPGETYNALLHADDGSIVPVSLEGQGAGSLVAKVPAGTNVSTGDAVVLPDTQGGFIATVLAISAPQGQSFETLYFRMPANVFALQYVEVWK